ncbi:META domain-containing protein [Streptomyces sp. NA04227]|uniref:META domain-containing protein n=1 Tax=Streptomyces sp. NA04227 TaxID=2742136 RepID=UPI0015925CB0|nr:META domain-containing protein [Streptomyces sp. NA04227]QKW08770.1 META domain-containing protein [Streptomyces sp. NA04227]
MRAPYALAALLALPALGACGSEKADGGAGSRTVGGDVAVTKTRWTPRTVTVDDRAYTVPPKTDAYVRFKPGKTPGAGGNSGGSTGCNQLGADVALAGDRLTVSDIAMTKMGCLGALGRFEERFVEVFHGELRAELSADGRDLTLSKDNGDSITFRAAGK